MIGFARICLLAIVAVALFAPLAQAWPRNRRPDVNINVNGGGTHVNGFNANNFHARNAGQDVNIRVNGRRAILPRNRGADVNINVR